MQFFAARQKAAMGLNSEITPEEYPDLSKKPEIFNTLRLTAIGVRVSELEGIKSLVQANPQTTLKVKTEISRLLGEASGIVDSWLQNEGQDERVRVPFVFGRNEAQSFEAAISLGLVNLIDEVNFPFLGAIHTDDVLRFKLLAIENALSHWKSLEGMSEQSPGFEQKSETTGLNKFANKKKQELEKLKEEIVAKIPGE